MHNDIAYARFWKINYCLASYCVHITIFVFKTQLFIATFQGLLAATLIYPAM